MSELIKTLAKLAPGIALEIIWSKDPGSRWDIEDSELDPNDFEAWQSEVRASAIVDGKLKSESSHMGGTWEKLGDDPRQSNPDISGYLPQMAQEAYQELKKSLPVEAHSLHVDCDVAIQHLADFMRKRYDNRHPLATA